MGNLVAGTPITDGASTNRGGVHWVDGKAYRRCINGTVAIPIGSCVSLVLASAYDATNYLYTCTVEPFGDTESTQIMGWNDTGAIVAAGAVFDALVYGAGDVLIKPASGAACTAGVPLIVHGIDVNDSALLETGATQALFCAYVLEAASGETAQLRWAFVDLFGANGVYSTQA